MSETTIPPHIPLLMRPARLLSVVERSSGLRVVLKRTAGAAGGLLRIRLLARRLVVVLRVVCESTTVGVAAQTVSAARIAIRILRENIVGH